jgi:hypothetical protein
MDVAIVEPFETQYLELYTSGVIGTNLSASASNMISATSASMILNLPPDFDAEGDWDLRARVFPDSYSILMA